MREKQFSIIKISQVERCLCPLSLVLICLLVLTACSETRVIDKVKKRGKLHVITRNAPAIYYEGREGLLGLEYELAQLFAQDLGVELDLKVASTRSQILSALDNNYTNLAAAFMVSSESRSERYQYSTPYMTTAPLVVYRYGSPRPRKIEDLMGKRIAVVSDSYHSEELAMLSENYPELTWQKLDIETIDLMKMVQDKSLDFAIITSAELDIHQSFYPVVKEAFALGAPQNISWYFPRNTDLSLISEADKFFNRIEEDGTLMYLKERYFGHLKQLNYVGTGKKMRSPCKTDDRNSYNHLFASTKSRTVNQLRIN